MSSSIGFVTFAQILFAHHAEEHRAVHFSSMRCLKNNFYLFIYLFFHFFFFFLAFIKFCSTTIGVLSATLRVEMRERFATNRTFHTFTVAIGNNIEAFGAFKHVRVACLRGKKYIKIVKSERAFRLNLNALIFVAMHTCDTRYSMLALHTGHRAMRHVRDRPDTHSCANCAPIEKRNSLN